MPRFKQLEQIQQVMNRKELIRNIGIIAHIDHGKTTLADSLLAGSGLLSTQMAGAARVLDYLEEEQKRKITIKTANISLLYKMLGEAYVVNLVDTPGHVDFTGKVTRALRVIDGVVVVVDAVEEIMAQTEILVKQAIEERVQPTLFINKIDRLILELQLTPEQIQHKFDHIISGFNDLIELYGEEQFKKKWKIEPSRGNVAFGSALHGWGFTVEQAKQKEIKFQDVVNAYRKGEQGKLQKLLPVYAAIFEMAIKTVPNPKVAQNYRLQKIWEGHIESAVGRSLQECSDSGPAVMCVTKVHAEEDGGCTASGRVFSGTIRKGDKLHFVDALTEAVVGGVFLDMGFFKEEVEFVSAGCLASVKLPLMVQAGETLVDDAHKLGMVPFEAISYVSEPVVTLAVEPKNPQDIPVLVEALQKLAVEDPNLSLKADKETGEYLLRGMGELHLEIAVNQLKSSCGLEVAVSSPRVNYVESVSKKGEVAASKTQNKLNSFKVYVEPEDEEGSEAKDDGEVLSIDEHRNALVDCNCKTNMVSEEVLEAVIAGFEFACKAGPLCGEPLRHVKVCLIDLQLSEKAECVAPIEIMHGVGKAVFGSFLTAKPVLLEPIYRVVVTVPNELSGECQKILASKRGKISSFEQKGMLAIIKGFIPVAETFGFSMEMRSATSGRAFWQLIFDHWERVPEKTAEKIIGDIRERKGLARDLPKPERFMDKDEA
jgi:elongation factor 2